MLSIRNFIVALFLLYFKQTADCVELTFELPDNAKECFYEEIRKNQSAVLEFQVITGGQYDVDVILQDPHKTTIYEQNKSQYDTHPFTAETTGIYTVCFSNTFSTFSHKLIYMDFQVGEEPALPNIDEHATALTQMESSAQNIHQSLNKVLDFQTHHRLREAQGRKRAEDINERVMWWAVLETAAVLCITIGQVVILRNFFTDRKPVQSHYSGKL
ncbi:unnamed protein product [Hermetia illucens]|uniref:GOLD domain-containing protein n=1 Tax=Hermetia illucens TaxID=343691 RepID=A0A7R8UPU3_HERIL|nr:transmembrane emp24 domain-containing protein 3 [Hermetia illucens]CAD7084807.1 unnamed protein product [Hermetia illucens]